jgi:glycosyltransferase involved in cell wall biosynthesis
MRIAFWVRAGNKYGSLERYIALFAEICKERGHAFLLINEIENTSKEFCDRLARAGAMQVTVGASSLSPIKTFGKTLRHFRDWKPDIVQLHFINSLAIPILKSYGVPLVYQTHHSSIDHAISLRTRVFRKLDNLFAPRTFAVSERVRLDEIRAGADPDKIEKMYLGLRLLDFEGHNLVIQCPEPTGWNDTQCRKIITIGRFFPVKGMRFVVEAAVQVMQEHQDVIWWIAGQAGPESEVCNRMIEAAGLRNRICVLGVRNDIPALLHRSDFQVVGSLSEGFGMMAIEAGACGIPTIGTRIGGLDEAILDGKTGLLVEAGSSRALAQAALWLLDHPDERERMGKAARQHVADHFNSESQIAILLDIFKQDLESRSMLGN